MPEKLRITELTWSLYVVMPDRCKWCLSAVNMHFVEYAKLTCCKQVAIELMV